MTGILSPALPADIPGEAPPQMPLAEDQPRVGDLDPRGEHKPSRASLAGELTFSYWDFIAGHCPAK